MPFEIKKVKGGYVVRDQKGHQFSNRPLAQDVAYRQRIAIALSEHKKNPKTPMSKYFV